MSDHIQELRKFADELDAENHHDNYGAVLHIRATAARWEREQGEAPVDFMEDDSTAFKRELGRGIRERKTHSNESEYLEGFASGWIAHRDLPSPAPQASALREALIKFLEAWAEEIGKNPKAQPELYPMLRRAVMFGQKAIENDSVALAAPQESTPAPSAGWIPVTERLPGERGHYFVATTNRVKRAGSGTGVFWWDGKPRSTHPHNARMWDQVTHWMPLPAAPEARKEEP